MVVGNGATNFAMGPSSTLDRAQGSAKGRARVRNLVRRDGVSDLASPVARQVVPFAIDNSDQYTVEKFQKNGAKVFKGGSDPMKAESWIDIIKKAFKAMSVPHCHQARLATCMLQEDTLSTFAR